MLVALEGPSAAVLTAGILLMSRARNLGQRLRVEAVGDPDAITPVRGPALLHSPVLASGGVGRDLGLGALVVVPGPPDEPVATCLAEDGLGEWFLLDRAGDGIHPATRAFVGLCRDGDPARRELGRQLRAAMQALGCPAEPALVDLLFGAPAPPLVRLAAALRAGRAMWPGRGHAITRFLRPRSWTREVPDGPCGVDELVAMREDGRLDALLDHLAPGVRAAVDRWLAAMAQAVRGPEDAALLCALVEVGAALVAMAPQGGLAPLAPAADAVAVGLERALGAAGGSSDATAALADTFRFLGGRFVPAARYAVPVPGAPPPAGRLARWRWLSEATRRAADRVDAIWHDLLDPPQ